MYSKYKEKAIPLVSVDQSTGKYVLAPEAIEFIKSVPGPIGVVSVAGLYRTGKSYLLNQMLLNRSSGFGVGPTINPCTKGLWCWGTPIKGETPDGQKLNIIVIDTEGIGALDQDQTHDTRIFTLAILASSCFIYNSVGSIDENAVQNLSLVVNLTKHIQLRAQKSVDDEDPDKISIQFPMFYWVVRDFSLQIADSEGNKMTSKQYLQRALAPQKGFSEDIEEKNRIRRLLTSFFKQRECFTLVRPLIEQSKLQDLDKMNFDDLRPEFVNQVINFRKRVTTKMKPKMIHGKKLNGQLYLSMLSSYVGAINDGAVPNIQNAWNYMCQQQCTKVMAESLETFETQLKEIKIPSSAQEMNKGIEAAEQAAFDRFKKKSIGDDAEKYYKQLQNKMRERTKELKKINSEQGKSAFKKYIAPFAAAIQQKITKQQYANFEDFLDQLKKLEEKVTKEGPNYVDSNLNCQICLNKILSQGVTYFFKRMKNQREQIKKTLEERIKINQNQVDALKRQRESQQSNMRQKISQLDREKVQMSFKLQKIQLELDRATKQKTSEGQLLSRNLNAKKQQVQQMRKQMQTKISEANARIEEMNKNLHLQQSNWEKQKAIYELKVNQQTAKLQELERKLQNSSTKMALETSEMSQKYREQTQKFQDQIQQLMRNLNEAKDKNEKYEERQTEMKEKYTNLTERFETVDRKLRQQTSSKARQIERLRNQHESEVLRVKNQMMQTRDDNEKVGRQMQQKMKKQDSRVKELAEELKNVKNRYQKQNQVMAQELEFAKRGLDETKQKLIETKSIYEQRIAAIEADSGLQREEQVKRKITELKSSHEDQLRNVQNEYKELQKNLANQIENLTRDRNELELKHKVVSEQLINERAENEEVKSNLTEKYKQLENQMKSIQRQRISELVTKQGHFNEKIAMLERDLEQARENYHNQKVDVEARTNDEITQIKNFYEMERQKMESRHSEEKQKLKKKYSSMVEDYEKRIQEETENHEQERQRMQSQYENEIRALTITCNELTHEKEMLLREKANLEQRLSSLTQKFNKMESELNERLQKLIETSKSEKQILTRKLEELQHNKNEMQKQILSLTHERDQYRSQSQKQASDIDELKSFNTNLNERYESTKFSLEQRLKQSQQRYLKQKSRFETQIALLQQKRDFAEQKIVQIEKDLKSTKDREQQQMKFLKERHEEDLASLILKTTTEKKAYEDKLEKVKKLSAQTETNLIRQLSEISKAKAVDEQKIEHLDRRLVETMSKTAEQIQSLSEQLKSHREKSSFESSQLKTRITELEQLVHLKQNELTDQKNSYDIKIALDDIKIKNLQQWGENNLSEKTQMIKNLQRQLDDARKRNENDKSSQQLTHQEILTRMESKYRSQITQLNQDVTKRTQQIQYMTKEHERVIKDLTQKLAIQRQTRMALETKATRIENDFIQRENKLSSEIDRLRAQKEGQSFEMQKLISREKELCKNKISEFERKMIESDKQKQQAIFEKQKQEARWKMQRNSLEQKIEQFRQACEKQKMESKKLMKDNEKLKAEKKKNASFIKNQTTIMTRQISTQNKENSQYQ